MKIGSFQFYDQLYSILKKNEKKKLEEAKKLNTQKKINEVADDTSGFSVSSALKSKNSILQSAIRNIGSALDMTSTAEKGLSGIQDLVTQLNELALHGVNASFSDKNRAETFRNLMQQMVAEIEGQGKKVSFNDTNLLDGTFTGTFQVDTDADNTKTIKISKSTATSLGNTAEGNKAYEVLSFNGINLGSAHKTSAANVVPDSVIADQTVTISNLTETKSFEISSALGNKSTDEILKALKNLNIEGVRESSVVSEMSLAPIGSSASVTEGDFLNLDLYVGNRKSTISFIARESQYSTEYNYQTAIQKAVNDINTANDDDDLVCNGYKITSKSGKNISAGNFTIRDNAAIRLGGFNSTTIPGSKISFTIDGISVDFIKGNNATDDALNLYNALYNKLRNNNPPLTYQTSGYDSNTNPPVNGYYTLHWTGSNVTISRNNGNTGINISGLENYTTQAKINNFINRTGEKLTLSIEGTQVSFTGASSQHDNAAALRDAINSNATLTGNGFSAQVSSDNVSVLINRTLDPDNNNDIYIDNFHDENNKAIISQFNNKAGEKITFNLDGQTINFIAGSTQTENAQNLKSVLDSVLDAAQYVLSVSDDSVVIEKQDSSDIKITNYKDSNNNLKIKNFLNVDGETVDFTINGIPISFIAAGSSDQLGNAQGLKAVIDSSVALQNAGITAQVSGNDLVLSANNTNPITISNYTDNNVSNSGFEVEAGAGSSGGGIILEGTTNGVSVTDNITGFLVTAGTGSSGGGVISEAGATSATVSDFNSSIYVSAGPGSTGSQTISESGVSFASITESKAQASISEVIGNNGATELSPSTNIIIEDLTSNITARPESYSGPARTVFLTGSIGGQVSLTDGANDWAIVTGVLKTNLDANLVFQVKTNIDGLNGAGLFYSEADKTTKLDYSVVTAQPSVNINNFSNLGSGNINLNINNQIINFNAAGETDQSVIANRLILALNSNHNLNSDGITYKLDGKGTGVLIYKNSGKLDISASFSSGDSDTGFDVTSIDAVDPKNNGVVNSVLEDGSYMMARFRKDTLESAEFKSFIPVSQMDYTTLSGLEAAQKVLKGAMRQAADSLSEIGTFQLGMQITNEGVHSKLLNSENSYSRIVDTDMAKEMVEKVTSDYKAQNALSVISKSLKITSDIVMNLISPSKNQ